MVIDYACGAGHFLTEAIEAINYFAQSDGNNAWARDHIYGIEKDYRLARVAKISLFMNGAGEGNIIFGDGLENVPDKGIENGTFDILVANPPYAVKDFKQHLQLKNNSFTLLDRIGMNGGEIETLFVERIAQLLKPQGVAAVILPSSILSNDSASYTGAREQLLQNFYIRGIAAFGSKTFGATGTNTVVMFLEKFNEPPKQIDLSADSVDAVFSGAELAEWKDKDIFEAYLAQIDVGENEYRAFLNKSLSVADLEGSKYFKMYVTAFADSADAKNLLKTKAYQQKSADEQAAVYLEKLYSYAYSIEREKLFYFSLVYQQTTVIITAPADNKAQKEFLGYDWSNRKGNEGIQIITPGGKMYDDADRVAQGTLAHSIKKSFDGMAPSFNEEQATYASVVNTKNMLDYCILFNYSAMCTFAAKNYKTLERNYKKAFYLSRIRRYDEAFFHFSQVAKQAFKESNYLLYYFAESNCISLRKVIKNVNTWYHCYNLDAVEALSPNDSEVENLFRRLPVEFRNTYDNLRDIHSANMLYKYSYEAFTDGQKLQKAIESGTTEFGMTSSGKAICRVNDYLHFLLGNGIVADVFSEYRNAVKNLMSLLVYKYSIQDKKVLHEKLFPFIGGNDVHFDEIDFHCFIEYFDAKEISALLNKHHIETNVFQHMDLVETAVNNLLDYYSSAVRTTKNNIDVIGLQTKIKNCLVLLRYVNISQGLVDKICGFILAQEFREILIDDKILFLDRQLAYRKMHSKETSRIVENTLISYLDKHISALKNGERFEVLSRNTGFNYYNLVHYIFVPGEKHFSRRLAARVSQIINNNLFQMNRQITQHYYGYVSNNQQKKLITWANKQLRTNFSFDLFEMLVQYDARISKAAKTQLKIFLRQRIDAAQENNNNGIVIYPTKQPYEELDQVGYWCLINVLNAKDFREFLGNSAAFDFYCEYTKFDFNRFDVSWLLNLYPHTLERIAKNEKVKGCVRVAIANALNDGEIALSDSQRLQSILIKHFC